MVTELARKITPILPLLSSHSSASNLERRPEPLCLEIHWGSPERLDSKFIQNRTSDPKWEKRFKMCYQNRQHQLPEQQGYGTLNAKGVQLHWVTSKRNLAALMCPCQLEMHSGVSLSNEAFYLFSGDVWRRQETNTRYTHTLGSLSPSEHCGFFVPLPLLDILKRRRKWTYRVCVSTFDNRTEKNTMIWETVGWLSQSTYLLLKSDGLCFLNSTPLISIFPL